MKTTVSLYVEENKWKFCKELGFNMSEELEKLMDLLLATSLTDNDPEATQTISRRHKLEKELRMVEKRKEEMSIEYTRVVEQENRYKLKFAAIEKNKQFSKQMREFNKIIVKNDYSLKDVMNDKATLPMLEILNEFDPESDMWTETKVLTQINRVRRYMEGF